MKKAKLFKIYDENGKELNSYKNVGNEENEQESFSIVKNTYRIIQHEDVYNTVNEAIEDKNLNANIKPNRIFDGNSGRLHIEVTFPEITLDVENDGLQSQLYCTYDNSYDGTTGLRLSVGAKRGNAILWITGSRYYHKHTKSVSVAAFENSLEKGIESFQTKIKGHFMGMFKTPTNEAAAVDFLENCIGIKNISNTYVKSLISKVKQSTIKNKWQLYCIICESITKEASSLDVRDRHLKALINRMHRVIKSVDEKVESPTTPEGSEGVSLKEVAEKHTEQNEVVPPQGEQLPEGFIAMELLPTKLSIQKVSRKKYKVMQGDTLIQTFNKYKKAERFIKTA